MTDITKSGSITKTAETTKTNEPKDNTANMIAGLASFFIPGLGQLLQQRYLLAFVFFLLSGVLWFFWLGWIINIISCINALKWNNAISPKPIKILLLLLLIIPIGLLVLVEAGFFTTLLYFKSDDSQNNSIYNIKEVENKSKRIKNLTEFTHLEYNLDNLSYTVTTSNDGAMTLDMSMVLVMEPTPEEINNKIILTPEDWTKFTDAIKEMDPLIRDALARRIKRMTPSELDTDRGQQMLREFVLESVNYQQQQQHFQLSNDKISNDRVREVLITDYFLY